MGKSVFLEFRARGLGLEDGFSVALQVQEDGKPGYTKTPGSLPPAPDLAAIFSEWSQAYRRLDSAFRGKIRSGSGLSNTEILRTSKALSDSLNRWLNSGEVGFQPVRDKLIAVLNQLNGEIRIIVASDVEELYKMPWHLWSLFDECPRAEVAVSPLASERPNRLDRSRNKIRILAIIGNKTGINLRKDKALLKQLPENQVEVRFLLQRPQQDFFKALRHEQGWDILFFAGHSWTERDTGIIHINQTDKLTIDDLKCALRVAIGRGLRLAIFNSCDGLGLAWDFAKLHIPHVIVMREPVPDKIAYEFFSYFFRAFAGLDQEPKSLYLAARSARDRLHDSEIEFPCASWLPVICHNPSEPSLTWQELSQSSVQSSRSSYEYIPKNRDDFYNYYAEQIANAKHEVWLTSDGFNINNSSSQYYARVISAAMYQAMRNGVKINRFQILSTMHLNWIEELIKIKRRFSSQYTIYINPRLDNIENFCVIDPGTNYTVTETMFSDIKPSGQYSIADFATFLHSNQSLSDRFLQRLKNIFNQIDTRILSVEDLQQLYDQLFEERMQKLRNWVQEHPTSITEGLATESGIFDDEIFINFQRE